ncbi:ATP-binding protein [Clostridium sp. C2-6-12]|uniref:sensor histidine kinase n=1 Tax=Clostridium sp. C2-6-12 TaxID=2698832 RepID=UPI001370EE96|nr:ATP-binding protein [Clostridium sp. C2-6-12]
MDEYHKLLKRQLAKYIGEEEIPENFKPFLEAINSAYNEFEKDKVLLERSLNISSREYQDNLEKIEKLQSQIITQEKMAGIGQLSAGIAHEINNPLGFVKSNIATLGGYKDKIKELSKLYFNLEEVLKLSNEELYKEKIKEIEEYKKKNKIKFIFDDIDDIVIESQDGIKRIETIVKSLLGFARKASSSEFNEYDINSNIRSTITIAYNEIKYYAMIEENLEEVPKIKALEGEINQVILNILVNAAHAIKAKGIQGIIKIHTYYDDNYVKCEISDNGIGISENNIGNIFNPFFTTKPIGIGTGLGLSISHDIIVNKHSGRIEVKSSEGSGTTFIISLPIDITKGKGINK